jgi:hypothetical protein
MNLNAFKKDELKLIMKISEHILYWRNVEQKVDATSSGHLIERFHMELLQLHEIIDQAEMTLLSEKLGLSELIQRVEMRLNSNR